MEEVISSIEENGMPAISVSPSSGKLLTMQIAISGAKNVLEIGALGGYSGICLARGFGSIVNQAVKSKCYTEVMKKFNEMVANYAQLGSPLIPIGDGLMISKVRK
ncbi:hypothetical protein [Sporosarcina sp. G11-34]|uniref:hypothetical protein n=1 Tax=Sporosarcina sp. G11-34 TaxID=2849605 RepID=UPI0022A9C52E|nr:hypothetical protein [Sporosarcina sp. G11-34]MCZ2259948.1 hypothetical protein [Sporosarcina sp. G11-34]